MEERPREKQERDRARLRERGVGGNIFTEINQMGKGVETRRLRQRKSERG